MEQTLKKPNVAAEKRRMDAIANDDGDQLWALFKAKPTDENRNRLVERYMPLVRNRAERVWSRLPEGIELDDLISAGMFGLMDAIVAYDMTRGVRFEAFSLQRIQGAILDELRSMDRVPRPIRAKATKLNEAYKVLESRLGRRPTDLEIADHLEIPPEELRQLFVETHNINTTSLDKSRIDNDGSKEVSEVDFLIDRRSEDPTERLAKIDLIRSFTKGLNKTERMIVILYYYEELTMREIGVTLQLSESRVSQMHSAIVERIKKLHQDR